MPEAPRTPAVFGLPPGADFPAGFVAGLNRRFGHLPPEQFARIQIYVNTRRMHRRIASLFDAGGATLVPRIRLVTELGQDLAVADLPPSQSPLRRRLELAQLVDALLKAEPETDLRSALYELADSLAALLDEMQGEGVGPEAIARIDATELSDHWRRRRRFLGIVLDYLEASRDRAPDPELRQRLAVERLAARWQGNPPEHPVIVAGSTGSRGTTGRFMEAVAALPQGFLVLPGFDFDLPLDVWPALDHGLAVEDHPQYRFRHLIRRLGIEAADVGRWSETDAPAPARNRLMSLALRPAPVTHRWRTEGPALPDLAGATAAMTLVRAPNPRIEAQVIALRLRKAVEDGVTAALISPDRMLTRRVAAALDRWGLEPDDSAGQPLALSPPGRLLRHVSTLVGTRLRIEDLLALLKHPLVNTPGGDGEEKRGDHLRWTRELELHLRGYGPPFPNRAALALWAERSGEAARIAWAHWIGDLLDSFIGVGTAPLPAHVAHHLDLARRLCAGQPGAGSGALWEKPAGRRAKSVMDELSREAPYGGTLGPGDYATMVRGLLDRAEVRDPVLPRPDVMIWGTLEARVQGADLVILGGLNEGVWPALPEPDPWLNRQMRKDAGLLMPERRIGLSAHDFQQAVAAPEVMLTRSARDADAETVPSRWLNRLCNLLAGLPETGKPALEAMETRGKAWIGMAMALDPVPDQAAPAPRPSPRPPVASRPRKLSVTGVQTLIRDPYAIYARHVLGLRPLNPLRHAPDAPLRGTILHDIFDDFIRARGPESHAEARARLLSIADRTLAEKAPWPVARQFWRSMLERVADRFLEDEDVRMADAENLDTEGMGELFLPEVDFTLTAKADRIDRTRDGALVIYDYKTGAVPTANQIRAFQKQLLLEAVMAEAGAFDKIPAARVDRVAYIGLGSTPKTVEMRPADEPGHDPATVRAKFVKLVQSYDDPGKGYTARRAVERESIAGDYDQLSRYGEWSEGQMPSPEDVP